LMGPYFFPSLVTPNPCGCVCVFFLSEIPCALPITVGTASPHLISFLFFLSLLSAPSFFSIESTPVLYPPTLFWYLRTSRKLYHLRRCSDCSHNFVSFPQAFLSPPLFVNDFFSPPPLSLFSTPPVQFSGLPLPLPFSAWLLWFIFFCPSSFFPRQMPRPKLPGPKSHGLFALYPNPVLPPAFHHPFFSFLAIPGSPLPQEDRGPPDLFFPACEFFFSLFFPGVPSPFSFFAR